MSRSKLWKKLEESAGTIAQLFDRETLPETLVILGSGFKGFETLLEDRLEVDFDRIPHMPVPSVKGHGASLCVGSLDGLDLTVMTGRVHLYEGYSAADVVYPIRVLSTLGVQRVMLTNASGSLDPSIRPGQIVSVRDQINMTGQNCLMGRAIELGPTFLDMSACFCQTWHSRILQLDDVVSGVYVGVTGPTYETPAETAMYGKLGGQIVGMSTVQEAIAAHHLKMRVACLSFVTNMAGGLGGMLYHDEVLELVAVNRSRLQDVLTRALVLPNET